MSEFSVGDRVELVGLMHREDRGLRGTVMASTELALTILIDGQSQVRYLDPRRFRKLTVIELAAELVTRKKILKDEPSETK